MSDTPAEARDLSPFVWRAKGNVLINGLGLGLLVQRLGNRPEVGHITVIEKSEDVLRLVRAHYEAMFGDRLTIIHGDAYEWQPPKGVRYNAVYHDIWDNLCVDNLPGMSRLKRKYGRRTDFQMCWGEAFCRREQRREARFACAR